MSAQTGPERKVRDAASPARAPSVHMGPRSPSAWRGPAAASLSGDPRVVPRAASCCFEPDHARRPTLCCTVQANAPNARWPATKGGHPGQDKGHASASASASASAPPWIPPRSGQLCGPSDRSGHELLISPDSPPGGGPRGGSWSPDARLPAPSLAFAKR